MTAGMVLVIIGVSDSFGASESTRSTGLTLRKAGTVIFLVLTLLQAYQTLVLVKEESQGMSFVFYRSMTSHSPCQHIKCPETTLSASDTDTSSSPQSPSFSSSANSFQRPPPYPTLARGTTSIFGIRSSRPLKFLLLSCMRLRVWYPPGQSCLSKNQCFRAFINRRSGNDRSIPIVSRYP